MTLGDQGVAPVVQDHVLDLLDRMLPAYINWVAENQNTPNPDIELCAKYLTYAICASFAFEGERKSGQFSAALWLWENYAIRPDCALMEILREIDKTPLSLNGKVK